MHGLWCQSLNKLSQAFNLEMYMILLNSSIGKFREGDIRRMETHSLSNCPGRPPTPLCISARALDTEDPAEEVLLER